MLNKIKNLYDNPHANSFLLCMVIFGVSLGLYMGVLNNYLHEVLGISRLERGVVEFPRELPGLLLFIIIAFLSRFSELKVMRFAFIVSMIGMIGMASLGDMRITAIVAIVLFSTGEHMMMPIQKSIAMHMAKPGNEGLAMGGVTSLANIGQVIGHYLIPLIFFLLAVIAPTFTIFQKFRVIFILAAIVVFVAILFVSRINETNKHIERRKIYFRKKYLKYYILEMFFGSRKQVFLTFAPYVLILKYGAKTEYIAFLYGLWSFSTIFLSPLVGKLLDKVGYKIVIIVDAFILMVLCLLYGFSHHFFQESTAFIIVSIVFVLDAILFLVGMARAMYVRSISKQEEITVVLSSGISINHLVSIIIAVMGGLLWERLGVEVLFSLAAFFGLGSLVFSLFLPSPKTKS
jgi:predicted MFS family arabinose efflux permease